NYLKSLGVGPEVLVGLWLDRGLEMLIGLLGTLKAGGAYVPLDPALPSERIDFMLKDAPVRIVLTQAHLLERRPPNSTSNANGKSPDPQLVCLDRDWNAIAQR